MAVAWNTRNKLKKYSSRRLISLGVSEWRREAIAVAGTVGRAGGWHITTTKGACLPSSGEVSSNRCAVCAEVSKGDQLWSPCPRAAFQLPPALFTIRARLRAGSFRARKAEQVCSS